MKRIRAYWGLYWEPLFVESRIKDERLRILDFLDLQVKV